MGRIFAAEKVVAHFFPAGKFVAPLRAHFWPGFTQARLLLSNRGPAESSSECSRRAGAGESFRARRQGISLGVAGKFHPAVAPGPKAFLQLDLFAVPTPAPPDSS